MNTKSRHSTLTLLTLAVLVVGAPQCHAAADGHGPVGWIAQDEVFYHIFVRSFRDCDGDRIGNLRGMKLHVDQEIQYVTGSHPWPKDLLGCKSNAWGSDANDIPVRESFAWTATSTEPEPPSGTRTPVRGGTTVTSVTTTASSSRSSATIPLRCSRFVGVYSRFGAHGPLLRDLLVERLAGTVTDTGRRIEMPPYSIKLLAERPR